MGIIRLSEEINNTAQFYWLAVIRNYWLAVTQLKKTPKKWRLPHKPNWYSLKAVLFLHGFLHTQVTRHSFTSILRIRWGYHHRKLGPSMKTILTIYENNSDCLWKQLGPSIKTTKFYHNSGKQLPPQVDKSGCFPAQRVVIVYCLWKQLGPSMKTTWTKNGSIIISPANKVWGGIYESPCPSVHVPCKCNSS